MFYDHLKQYFETPPGPFAVLPRLIQFEYCVNYREINSFSSCSSAERALC